MAVTTALSNVQRRKNTSGFFQDFKRYRAYFLMLLPGLAILLINNYLPLMGLILAFKKYDYRKGILGSEWSGFKNFEIFIKTPDAWLITRNTIGFNLMFIFLGLVFAVAMAIALNEIRNRLLAKFFQTSLLLPYFISWIVASVVGYSLLSTNGFINTVLNNVLGLKPVDWYFKVEPWIYILPVAHLWKTVGYSSVIYLASITGFDEEIYEAVTIDGANKWQQVIYITLPLLKPIITIMTILSIGKIFNADFGLFYQFTMDSGALFPVTNVLDTYVYRALLKMNSTEMSTAVGLYQGFVGFVFILVSNQIVKKFDRENSMF